MKRILVTDGEQRSSLAVVRSLGRAGHLVETCSFESRPLAGVSRYCRRSHTVPNAERHPEGYQEAVTRLVVERDIDILVPVSDVSLALLIDLTNRCPDLMIPCSGRTAYESLSDKKCLMDAASRLGIPVPSQIVLEGAQTPRAGLFDELGVPIVLKPSRSVTYETPGPVQRHGVKIVSTPTELNEALGKFTVGAYPILAQERIAGPGKGVFLLTWDDQVQAFFGHRRLREKPPTGGVSVYRESIDVPPHLLSQARRLLQTFGWNGPAMVEFKEERESGEAYLMEVNARFWGSLQLAIDSGVDFPRLLIDLATGERPVSISEYRTGVRSRWLWGEVDHVIGCFRTAPSIRRTVPDLPGPWRALGRLLIPWQHGDRFEVLRRDDPVPFLRESAAWLRNVFF